MNNQIEPMNRSQMLLNAKDIALLLNISKSMAYKLMNANELPTIKIGLLRRVQYTDLEKYVNEHKSHINSEKS